MLIIDVFSGKSRHFSSATEFSRFAGVKVSTAYHFLRGRSLTCLNRYVKTEDLEKLFVLKNVISGAEYLCANAMTMEVYLNIKLTRNELAKISNLKNDCVFMVKLSGEPFVKTGSDKGKILSKQKSNNLLYGEESRRKYYETHKEKELARARAWKAENRERIKSYNKKYFGNRLKNDEMYRLKQNLRSRLRMALKNNKKASSTMSLTGCDLPFLKNHLESQFKTGMSWLNYGSKWSVDHIIPCSHFDFSCAGRQRKCFNYRNLQPLWNWENLKKSDSLPNDN